jgi:hypothetical protein
VSIHTEKYSPQRRKDRKKTYKQKQSRKRLIKPVIPAEAGIQSLHGQ